MSKVNLVELILTTCKTARLAGQYIEVDYLLPSILYHRDGDISYHFQDSAAQDIFDYYRATAEATGVALRDVLLWAAQEWNLEGSQLVIGNCEPSTTG